MTGSHEDEGLVARLKQARCDIYGEDGIPQLAGLLGIPQQTWVNYESGVSISGRILLQFLCLTGIRPAWLATGQKPVSLAQDGVDESCEQELRFRRVGE